jgi:hypothetical protein
MRFRTTPHAHRFPPLALPRSGSKGCHAIGVTLSHATPSDNTSIYYSKNDLMSNFQGIASSGWKMSVKLKAWLRQNNGDDFTASCKHESAQEE